jgi:hypothetical protein
LKFCHFQSHFLITAAVGIGAAGKGKKKILFVRTISTSW